MMSFIKKYLRKMIAITLILIIQLCFSQYVLACSAQELPTLPNIETAVTTEMVKAQKGVKNIWLKLKNI
ncbi:hypothetical protein [Dasania marina]|uniref:hypothetical protein n=1 Tax=Dasania marina TaxID=471499 RepID=UPI0030D80336|tara:strand:- start:3510 stop:3716 length:207 start_codon:yes stop_codon:yes gene_type:complete